MTVNGDFKGSAVLRTVLVKTIGDERLDLGKVMCCSVDADTVSVSDGIIGKSSPADFESTRNDISAVVEYLTSVEPGTAVLAVDAVACVVFVLTLADAIEEVEDKSIVEVVVGMFSVVPSFPATVVACVVDCVVEVGATSELPGLVASGVVKERPSQVKQHEEAEYSIPRSRQVSTVQGGFLSPYSHPDEYKRKPLRKLAHAIYRDFLSCKK